MKQKMSILFVVFLLFVSCAKTESTEQVAQKNDVAKVTVYYFHGKQRCPTCVSIQQVAQSAVDTFFANNEDVRFVEVDFSVKKNDALAEKYEVAFSSLIIATADAYSDITDQAFALATSNPEQLKTIINQEVTKYLNQ